MTRFFAFPRFRKVSGNIDAAFIKNVMWLGVAQFFSMAAPYVVLGVVARRLGIEIFGVVTLTLVIVQICTIFTDFGFYISGVTQVSVHRRSKVKIRHIASGIYTAKIFLLVPSMAILLIALNLGAVSFDGPSVFAALLILLNQAFVPTWLFHGAEKASELGRWIIGSKLGYAVLVVLLIDTQASAAGVLFLLGITGLMPSLFALLWMQKHGYFPNFLSSKLAMRQLKYSKDFFVARAAVSTYSSISAAIVGIQGIQYASQYNSSEILYRAGQAVVSPIVQGLLPRLGTSKDFKMFYFVTAVAFFVLTLLVMIAIVFMDDLFVLIYGSDFLPPSALTVIFLVMIPLNFITASFGYPAFTLLKSLTIPNQSAVLGAIICLISLVSLYFCGGITPLNVALVAMTSEVIVLTIRVGTFFRLKIRSAYA